MKKLFIRVFVFSGILGSLLYCIDSLFLENQSTYVSTFNSLYEFEKNSTDVLFLGSSHLNKGIDTYIIDAKCKINSTKVSAGGINIVQVYYNLLEALTNQSPQIVAIEMWPIIEPTSINNTLFNSKNELLVHPFKGEYYKRFGVAKYNEISLIYPENSSYHMFNFLRFHENWTDMNSVSNSLSHRFSSEGKKINYDLNKKLWKLPLHKIKEFESKTFDFENMYLSEQEEIYLNKIINLSKNHKFELLLFSVPVYDVYYNKTKSGFEKIATTLKNIEKDNSNVKFYDINSELGGLNYSYIMNGKVSQNQHLNYKGIIKTSNLMANFINKEYTLNKQTTINDNVFYPEKLLYNTKEFKKDSTFLGKVYQVKNNKIIKVNSNNEIVIDNDESVINIEGWMFKKEINFNRAKKILALKKGDDFIFLSGEEMKDREAKSVINKFGNEYMKSGYNFNINKEFLEKGKYKIFHIVESQNKEIFIQDMWKWIVVK
nr:hypothetical protein [uncultured Psychroserpens sp.]